MATIRLVHDTRSERDQRARQRRRSTNFRDTWVAAILDAGVSDGAKLLMYAYAKHMKATGYVSFPRYALAAELGITERRVGSRTSELIEAGWLVKLGGGFRGHTCVYRATFGYTKSGNRALGYLGKGGLPPSPLVRDIGPTKVDASVLPIRARGSYDVAADHLYGGRIPHAVAASTGATP